jgi:hypothetical protein
MKAQSFVIKADVPMAYIMTAFLRGAGAVAQVTMPTGDKYTVVSSAAHNIPTHTAKLKAEVESLPGAPRVEWVRPLTVRLQRLFGWGDITATREDVERAVQEDDVAELRFLVPGAARMIEEGRLDALPALMDAPAQEPEESPYAALYPKSEWRQHPERPEPFYVIDHSKVPEAEKLEWIRQEIGDGATIGEFAARFMGLFGGKIRGAVSQKKACLLLFGAYTGGATKWGKESDIPPAEREQFREAWGEHEKICRECGRTHDGRGLYCGTGCEDAGKKRVCKQCGASVDAWFPHCAACGPGAGPSEAMMASRGRVGASGSFDEWERGQVEQFARMSRLRFGEARDEDHEPAWKNRRRT